MSLGASTIDQLSPKELKVAQDLALAIGPVKQAIESGRILVQSNNDPPDVGLISQESPKLEIKDGILYRDKKTQTGRVTKQLFLPERCRTVVH